jgi:hypothetical protein
MEVWPSGPSTFVSLLEPPGFYAPMVAAEEYLGHLEPAPERWLGVDRAFDEIRHTSGSKRIIDNALAIAQDSR